MNENSPCFHRVKAIFFYHSTIVRPAQVVKLKQLGQLRRSNVSACVERGTPRRTITTTGIGGNSTARACATARRGLAPSAGAAGNCSSHLGVGLGTPGAPAVSAHHLWVHCSAGREEAARISERGTSVERWAFKPTENEHAEEEIQSTRAREREERVHALSRSTALPPSPRVHQPGSSQSDF